MPPTLTELATRAQAIANRANQRKRDATQPRNDAPPVTLSGTTAKIRLYQSIDDWGEWFGMSANELVGEIDKLPSNIDTIELAINSPGGSVFEAIAIVNALRRHEAHIVAVVDGFAASAASFIAASADETVMMPNSQMMIHAAWGCAPGCVGDASDVRDHVKVVEEYASLLDDVTLNICTIYEAKSGTPAADWLEMMAGVDVWLTAERAVELGLADRVGIEAESDPSNIAPPLAAQVPAPKASAPKFSLIAATAQMRRR